MSGGKGAGAGAGIGGVDGSVGKAIESHGSRARGDHGNDDPQQLTDGGNARGCEHGPAKREWESEDGVLPLDHVERHAQIAEEGHCRDCKTDICLRWEPLKELHVLSVEQRGKVAAPGSGDKFRTKMSAEVHSE